MKLMPTGHYALEQCRLLRLWVTGGMMFRRLSSPHIFRRVNQPAAHQPRTNGGAMCYFFGDGMAVKASIGRAKPMLSVLVLFLTPIFSLYFVGLISLS